jgi:hypothetical protein
MAGVNKENISIINGIFMMPALYCGLVAVAAKRLINRVFIIIKNSLARFSAIRA